MEELVCPPIQYTQIPARRVDMKKNERTEYIMTADSEQREHGGTVLLEHGGENTEGRFFCVANTTVYQVIQLFIG